MPGNKVPTSKSRRFVNLRPIIGQPNTSAYMILRTGPLSIFWHERHSFLPDLTPLLGSGRRIARSGLVGIELGAPAVRRVSHLSAATAIHVSRRLNLRVDNLGIKR